MDPISLGIGIVGLGLQLFGTSKAVDNSRQIAGVNRGIASDEQQINAQKQQAMELSARRMQLENLRNNQRLRAQATNAATNQGAQFGSGLQGGLAQIEDQSLFNMTGVSQNLEIGRNIFGINTDISQKKMQLADLQGQQATNTALTSLGGALVKEGPIIGGLAKDVSAWGSRNLSTGFGGPYV